ncbi:hypothetical protein N7453_004267 [Penicillium expansum]|nr:hypothetical protein N7453_004267 [Penicillium expansum]
MNDNIHAPTVASGPVSGGLPEICPNYLMQEKERIEAELSALSSVLQSHGVRMTSSLTTFDGFPRDDIDIAQVRTTRVRIIHLRNDHKEVMQLIEKGVHAHFANLQNSQGASPTTNGTNVPSAVQLLTNNTASGTPFAKVNSVVSGSPADQAGLKVGDAIRSFGNINWLNHERLSKVAQVVQANEGRAVSVKVSRKHEANTETTTELDLQLTPRQNWGGRGLLGCHLVPL